MSSDSSDTSSDASDAWMSLETYASQEGVTKRTIYRRINADKLLSRKGKDGVTQVRHKRHSGASQASLASSGPAWAEHIAAVDELREDARHLRCELENTRLDLVRTQTQLVHVRQDRDDLATRCEALERALFERRGLFGRFASWIRFLMGDGLIEPGRK